MLKEIEALVQCRLCEKFDLIYGTSTGAIIAALLCGSYQPTSGSDDCDTAATSTRACTYV